MSNVGSGVSGFDVRKQDISSSMTVFDRLPKKVRDGLNYANAEWSVEYFAEFLWLGPDIVSSMVKKSDDEWTRTAYRDRGFQ